MKSNGSWEADGEDVGTIGVDNDGLEFIEKWKHCRRQKKNRDKNANIRIHIDGMSIYFTITSFLTEKREKKMSRNVTSLIDEWI